ncbi:MAG: hemerythrin family protein [Thiotrichales bacterium]|nr:hemerythrin family protein [Thiotrichales bacterium]
MKFKNIEWCDEFSLGIPDVDFEHRELIELINESLEHISQNISDDTVIADLGEILARISSHFALEEKIMRNEHYDEYEDHKADHERLLDEIHDFIRRYEEKKEFDEKEFGTELMLWFTEHFRTKDARMHKQLHSLNH